MKINKQDYINKTYNRLTIISFEEPRIYANKNGYFKKATIVKCLCECGNIWKGLLTSVINNKTKSCGCFSKEIACKNGKNNTKHNLVKSSEYKTWRAIKARCLNPKNPAFHNYGGRGITICDRWLNSFENFLEDMGRKPSKNHSIDRINNNGNYELSNCKWSSKKEQSNNQRINKIVTYNEKTQTLRQWSEELKIDYNTLFSRINTSKWSIEKAFKTPININYKRN